MSPEERHLLGGIYDIEPDVYRRGGTQAGLKFQGGCMVVIRPWIWLPDPEIADWPAEEKLGALLALAPSMRATAILGRLLIWASRRTPWSTDLHPSSGDEDAPMFDIRRATDDAQRCGTGVFDRRLIREALQSLVENTPPIEALRLEIVTGHSGGDVLRIDAGHTTALLMSTTSEPGSDPMPVAWEAAS